MNDSIQSTLFSKYDKDAYKSYELLKKELDNLEQLMSYDKRPIALANFDKRRRTLQALIEQKKPEVKAVPREKTASRNKPIEEGNLLPKNEIKVDHSQIMFTGLLKLSDICD